MKQLYTQSMEGSHKPLPGISGAEDVVRGQIKMFLCSLALTAQGKRRKERRKGRDRGKGNSGLGYEERKNYSSPCKLYKIPV